MLCAVLPLELRRMQKGSGREFAALLCRLKRLTQTSSLPSPGGCRCLQKSSQRRQTADLHVGRKAADTLVQGSLLGSDRSHLNPYGMDLVTLCLGFLVCGMGTITIHTSSGGCEDETK